jgi:hypothetical protein
LAYDFLSAVLSAAGPAKAEASAKVDALDDFANRIRNCPQIDTDEKFRICVNLRDLRAKAFSFPHFVRRLREKILVGMRDSTTPSLHLPPARLFFKPGLDKN